MNRTEALNFLAEILDAEDNQDSAPEELEEILARLQEKSRGYDLYRLQSKLNCIIECTMYGDTSAMLLAATPLLPLTNRDIAYNTGISPEEVESIKLGTLEPVPELVAKILSLLKDCVELELEYTRRKCVYFKT